MSIAWPALLRLSGEAELQVVQNQAEWDADPHLHAAHYLADDILIDAEGHIHALQPQTNRRVLPVATGEVASLQEVIAYVQAHSAQMGACCVAKFSASTIREAIASVTQRHCLP